MNANAMLESYYQIQHELFEAEKDHPHWPTDVVHGCAIMIEEAGEAMQAALDLHNGVEISSDHLLEELAQTAAMCIRNMVYLRQKRQEVLDAV